jgi:hypothetical protein
VHCVEKLIDRDETAAIRIEFLWNLRGNRMERAAAARDAGLRVTWNTLSNSNGFTFSPAASSSSSNSLTSTSPLPS